MGLAQTFNELCIAPPTYLTDHLQQIGSLLNTLFTSPPQPTVSPKAKIVTPNQHSWPETELVMGAYIRKMAYFLRWLILLNHLNFFSKVNK